MQRRIFFNQPKLISSEEYYGPSFSLFVRALGLFYNILCIKYVRKNLQDLPLLQNIEVKYFMQNHYVKALAHKTQSQNTIVFLLDSCSFDSTSCCLHYTRNECFSKLLLLHAQQPRWDLEGPFRGIGQLTTSWWEKHIITITIQIIQGDTTA